MMKNNKMQKNYKKKNNNATIVSILLGAEVVQCALIHMYIYYKNNQGCKEVIKTIIAWTVELNFVCFLKFL